MPESGWGCLELAGGASGQALSMRPTEANRAIASARVSVRTEEDHHEHVTTRKLQWPSLGRPLGTVVTSGVPRSGTSWLDRLARRLLSWSGLQSASDTFQGGRTDDFPLNDEGDDEYHRLVEYLNATETGEELRCLKTHFVTGLSSLTPQTVKWLYIYRDPRDVITSSTHWLLSGPHSVLPAGGDREALLQEHVEWLLPRIEQSLGQAVSSDPGQCLLVSYARLQSDAPGEIERISRHLGLDLPRGMAACIANRHSFERESGRTRGETLQASYHRRGLVGGWEQDLFPDIRAESLLFHERVQPLLVEVSRRCG